MQAGQPSVGAHPQAVAVVPNKRGHYIRGKTLRSGQVAHLLRPQVVVVDAASVGGYPEPVAVLEAHGIDEVVVVDIAKLLGIEEAEDAGRASVDEIGTVGGPYGNGGVVWRLYDTLHLFDGILLAASGREVDQWPVEASYPQLAVAVGEQAVDIVGLEVAQGVGID